MITTYFQTQKLNYKLLSTDSLNLLRNYIDNEPDPYQFGIKFENHQITNRNKFLPYLNLLKPFTNILNNLDLIRIAGIRIDPNQSLTSNFSFRKQVRILIPLYDYSRNEKIFSIGKDTVGLNSTLVYSSVPSYKVTNNFNTKFSYIIYVVGNDIEEIKNILQ